MAKSKKDLIYENHLHLIYFQNAENGKAATIQKQLNSPFPSDELVAQLKNEYLCTKDLQLEGVRRPIRLKETDGKFILELEYIEGASIKDLLSGEKIELIAWLKVLSKLAEIIGQIHKLGWIHGSICSSNVLLKPTSLEPTLIDFTLMSKFNLQSVIPLRSEKLQRIIRFISPEQTGRTNRNFDHRSDLYSFGILCYEILTGDLPFEGGDPLELIYAHLTREPTAPAKLNKQIPNILSQAVIKLMAKNPEDRYQSIYGFKFDLDRIIENWETSKTLSFNLGERDFTGVLQVPQKLFGKEKETKILKDNLIEVANGGRRMVLVSGVSGTGKSSIVRTLKRPMVKTGGLFLEGKFDQLARNIPYSAWIEIFKDFVNQILTCSEEEIADWQDLLSRTLGNEIGVLADLIPNLQFVVQDFPPAEALGPAENQNRLNILLNRFFKAISTPEHPICIFIDDLQWADDASINLLKSLAAEKGGDYLLMIVAFRSEEIAKNSTIWSRLNEMKNLGLDLETIRLENLTAQQINFLLAETLRTPPQQVKDLAQAIFQKTQGNPYFSTQFIQTLFEEALLIFDWEASLEKKEPIWKWDLARINTKFISTNVVDLLIDKIVELPEPLVETLKIAACIGNTFRIENLSTVRKKGVEADPQLLESAILEGFVFYKKVNGTHLVGVEAEVEYQFAHDQVQQAFYSLIIEEERLSTHYEIGKNLFSSLAPEELTDKIFPLVFHLNCGKGFVQDQKEKKWIAGLNLQAGKEAKRIIAYDSAYEYLSIAKHLTQDFIWNEDQGFAMKLGLEFLECAYLNNQFEEAENYFDFLLAKTPDVIQKADLHYRKMIRYQNLSKIDNILDIGLAGLDLLGYHFKPNTNRLTLVTELVRSMIMIRGKSVETLEALPLVSESKARITMDLIYKMLTFAYDRSEELMGVLGMKLLQLTLKKGIHPGSIGGYSTFGGVLSIGFKNYDEALKYNKLAISAAEKCGDKAALSLAYFGLGMTGYVKLKHKKALEAFKTSQDLAMEAGAHTDAAPSTMYFFFLNFLLGKRLNELRQIVQDKLYFTAQIKTDNFHLILLAGLQVIEELKHGQGNYQLESKGEIVSSAELEHRLQKTEHKSIRIYSRIFQMFNHVFFERFELAKQCEKEILEVSNVMRGTVLGPFFEYLRCLLYSRLYHQLDKSEQLKTKKLVKKTSKLMALIAKHNPTNYKHWDYLLKAELNKLEGRKDKAQKWYDKAINVARSENYLHELAIANFYCSLFHKEEKNTKIAGFYRSQSVLAFKAWGAEALAKHLASEQIAFQRISNQNFNQVSLDQESLIKLAENISGEINFEKLIVKLMHIFTENAGAERAFLILHDKEGWFIEAEQRKNEEVKIVRRRLPEKQQGTEKGAISVSVCQYVIRTKKMIILDEASQDDRFAQTPYIRASQPRSILCMPLVKQNQLTGLVYLENNLISGAFKADRTRMLGHISAQMAVSVDNARLYSDLRILNHAYERFVPREFLNILGKNSITDVHLGDQVQMNMTVLFADIRGFTSISEGMKPAEIFDFINAYLNRMGPIIRKYNGFVDKYIGDEIMALFPGIADDAIQCGIAMLHELKVFGEQMKKEGMEPIEIGIGVNTGKLILGTVGVENRMNSTVVSDVVNIASRVEKHTKDTGAPFMITKETVAHLKHPMKYGLRKLGKTVYRGKSTSTYTYEVFASDRPQMARLKQKHLNLFEKGVTHYEKGEFQAAEKEFSKVLKENPLDAPALYFKNRIQDLLQGNVPHS